MKHAPLVLARSASPVLVAASLLACGGSEIKKQASPQSGTQATDAGSVDPNAPKDLLPGLHALAVPPGGTSFYTPVLTLKPGEDVTYCTYTSTIANHDLFVHSTRGSQSKMGHHTLLFYAPTPTDARTEICSGQSMESLRQMIGGGGGEGTATWVPPDNVGTVVPTGSQLVLQSHWINTGTDAVDVQAMMITEPGKDGPGRIEAGTFTVVDLGFEIPAQSRGTTTTTCVAESEHRLLMTIGHEHEWGTHVRAQVTRTDGTVKSLFDRAFSPHDVFDPPIDGYTVDAPLTFAKGDTIQLSCDWQNTTDQALGFPREMCVLFGFTMDPGDARCINGGWMTPGSGDAGVGLPGPPCAQVGAAGNDADVGKYCTKGGGECNGTQSTICLADYTSGQFGDFCTKLCTSNATCGTGAACVGSSGSPKICIPNACTGGADAGTP